MTCENIQCARCGHMLSLEELNKRRCNHCKLHPQSQTPIHFRARYQNSNEVLSKIDIELFLERALQKDRTKHSYRNLVAPNRGALPRKSRKVDRLALLLLLVVLAWGLYYTLTLSEVPPDRAVHSPGTTNSTISKVRTFSIPWGGGIGVSVELAPKATLHFSVVASLPVRCSINNPLGNKILNTPTTTAGKDSYSQGTIVAVTAGFYIIEIGTDTATFSYPTSARATVTLEYTIGD